MLAKGTNGTIELHEHHIVIKRNGIINAMNGLAGEKSISFVRTRTTSWI